MQSFHRVQRPAGKDRIAAGLLRGTALIGILSALLPGASKAETLDLAGTNRTLPFTDPATGYPYFNGQSYLNNAAFTGQIGPVAYVGDTPDNVTNNNAAGGVATLTEGGAPAPVVYSGVISDSTQGFASRTGIVHTSGTLTLNGANTFSGGLLVSGGTVVAGANQTLGAITNAVTIDGANARAALRIAAGTTDQIGALQVGNGVVNVDGRLIPASVTVAAISGEVQVSTGGVVGTAANNATVLSNRGTIGNAGTWVGPILANTGRIGNAGLWTGALASNNGLVGNAGTWVGAINNSAGGTFVNAGTIAGALTNAGTVNAIGGVTIGAVTTASTFNGAITNRGAFNITGPVTINGASFDPGSAAAAATTLTSNGIVTSNADFDNFGTLSVSTGAAYRIAGNLRNEVGGTVTVAAGGSLTDDLINAGLVTNNGTYTANVNPNTGTIANTGTWNGTLLNAAGGVVTNVGTWNGDTTNTVGGLITNSGTFNGNVTNNGVFASTGTGTITQTLTNSGTIDLTQGGSFNTLTANNYVGQAGSQVLVNVDLRSTTVSATGGQASLVTLNGASGSSSLVFRNTGSQAAIAFFPSIQVVNVASGANNVFVADAASLSQLSNGLVSYGFNNGALIGSINAANAASAGILATTALTTLNSNFFQDWQPFERQAFITAPQDPPANTISGGPWVRGKYGNETNDAVATALGNATDARVDTEFSGFQVGGDVGIFNTNKTGWNFIGGVTGGEFFATSLEKRGGSTKGNIEIPFVGAYGAITNGPFLFDVLYHHDFYGLRLNDAPTGLAGQSVSGEGDSVHIESSYNIGLGNFGSLGNLFIAPTGSIIISRVDLDDLPFSTLNLGRVKFDTIDSLLGRGGFKFGSNIVTETLALQPFMVASVWHEFDGKTTSQFDATSGISVPMTVSRIGTFGQVGLGLNGELLGKNILGTIRGDFRFGDNTSGESVTAQLRYQF